MTEYILYTQDIDIFLEAIYNCNIRLTETAYIQLLSLIPKTILKILDLKKYKLNDNFDEKFTTILSDELNKMKLNEIKYTNLVCT